MVVTEDTDGLSDSLTTHDKTQTNAQGEIKDANYVESSDAAELAAQRAAAENEAAQWKQNHNAILSKSINSITKDDIAAIQKAIDEYCVESSDGELMLVIAEDTRNESDVLGLANKVYLYQQYLVKQKQMQFQLSETTIIMILIKPFS